MAASGASTVITSATIAGVAVGICTNYSIQQAGSPLPLSEQGNELPSAIGFVAKGFVIVCSWIAGAGGALPALGTKGTSTFVVRDLTGGGTKTYAVANMKVVDGLMSHTDRGFAIMTATCFCEDSADATTFSES